MARKRDIGGDPAAAEPIGQGVFVASTSASIFAPKNLGGRPRAAEPSTAICTWLPATYHDRLIALANQRGESVSAVVRQLLVLRLR